MSSFQLILFDCDGVIVDSEPITNRIFADMVRPYGIELDQARMFAEFSGKPLVDNMRDIERQYGITLPADFADRFRAQSRQILATDVKPVPGIEALLDSLTLPYAVASSGRFDKMRTTLGATGLLPRFTDRLFSAEQVARPKPAPDVYLHAAAHMGVAPAHCLVIEDSPSGVQAGVAAGMTVYGHACHLPAQRLLDAGATRTFANMTQLQQHLKKIL